MSKHRRKAGRETPTARAHAENRFAKSVIMWAPLDSRGCTAVSLYNLPTHFLIFLVVHISLKAKRARLSCNLSLGTTRGVSTL